MTDMKLGELTEEQKAFMLKQDKMSVVYSKLVADGADEGIAQVFSESEAVLNDFTWNGARCGFKLGDEEINVVDPRVKEALAAKYPTLFTAPAKAKAEQDGVPSAADALGHTRLKAAPEISDDLAHRAFVDRHAGARAEILKQVGKDKGDRLAQQFGLRSFDDYSKPVAPNANTKPGSKNPWRVESWSITEQGRIHKALGNEKAAAMAAAAGSRIGATKPSA
jgi:hypothetical protein